MALKPIRDRIVVKVIDEAEQTTGGIFIPDSAKEMRINETGKTSIILANRMSRKKSDIQKKSPSVISIDYKGWPDGKAKTLCDKMYRALLEKDDRQIEL